MDGAASNLPEKPAEEQCSLTGGLITVMLAEALSGVNYTERQTKITAFQT